MRAGFVFSEVATGIRRNVAMTVAMILVTAVSLGILGYGLVFSAKATQTQQLYSDKLSVQIYLTADLSSQDIDCRQSACQALRTELTADPLVESVAYESQPAAYKRFLQMFAGQPEIIAAGREAALNASFQVKLKDPSKVAAIAKQYGTKPGVKEVQDSSQVVDKLLRILRSIRNAALGLALVLAVAAVLLIGILVHIAALNRRTETSIMRLVGASRWRTELPFMIEALISGLVGAGVAIGLMVVAQKTFVGEVLGGVISTGVVQPVIGIDIFNAAWKLVIIAVVMSLASAWVTLRSTVKV